MNIKKLARYFIWQLPNSKAIPIAEFISILENNLNLAYEELQWRKHKSWSVITDYVEVLSFLHSQDTWTLWFLLKYYDLPKDFICKIDFSEHIIKCTGWSSDWLKSISDSLEGMNETDFSRFIVMPILQQMGYEEISYKWKVNSTDYWNDFFPMKFVSPWGITHYIWVQSKSVKMTQWDTTDSCTETNKLIAELTTALWQSHITIDWEVKRLSEMIVMNSKTMNETTRAKIFNDEWLINKKIIIYDKDWVLSLIEKYNIKYD